MSYITFSSILAGVLGIVLGFLIRIILGRFSLLNLDKKLKKVQEEAIVEIENEKNELFHMQKLKCLKRRTSRIGK